MTVDKREGIEDSDPQLKETNETKVEVKDETTEEVKPVDKADTQTEESDSNNGAPQ